MTRINLVDPALLSRLHLIAELRELPRIYGLVKKAVARGESPQDKRNPLSYKLGTGHVRFFYPRLGFLFKRHKLLIQECLNRGYKINFTTPDNLLEGIPKEFIQDWEPTEKDVQINLQRINERGGLRND